MKNPEKLTFLIVDDVDNMRRSIRSMLKLINFGRHYLEAPNGLIAWRMLEENDPPVDFIISDYKMPHLSGVELLSRVRANKKTRDMPFLMITAEANMEVLAEAAEQDVDGYMTKPFVTATMEQKIIDLLNKAANPSLVTTHLRQLVDLEEKGDLEGALQAAKQAISAKHSSSRPYREMGRLLYNKGELNEALGFFKKAIEMNRLDVSSYHHLGQIYHKLGFTDKAIENYSKAMTISPRHADRALNFAQLLVSQDMPQEAQKVVRLLFKATCNDLETKERLITFCISHGIYDLALKASKEILREDPNRTEVIRQLGIALFHAGEYGEAAQTLEKAAANTETDFELWLTLAKSYLALRKIVRAEKWAIRIVRLSPDNKEAKEILDKCL